MRFLGVDPGLFGAAALWDDADPSRIEVFDAPVLVIAVGKSKSRIVLNDAEYARIIRELRPGHIKLEQVGGITGQSASASFTFGAGFGLIKGLAAGLEIPLSLVPPTVWQAKLRVPAGKDGARLRASQIFPSHSALFARKKDDGRADAALIARCQL